MVQLLYTALFLVIAVWLIADVTYLLLLACVGLLRKKTVQVAIQQTPHFTLIVPAHNEEASLAMTLESLQSLDYPTENFTILVVADNCTDTTVAIARAVGVRCIERHDTIHIGKGYALQAAFAHVLAEKKSDAVVVIDADIVVSHNMLKMLAAELRAENSALQTAYRLVPQAGSYSIWLSVENILEDQLFYGSRERLGFPTLLRGTGMCLSLSLLRRVPYSCTSMTEDVEYTIQLLKAEIRPRFVPEATVYSAAPSSLKQINQQRQRWSGGHFRLAFQQAHKLFIAGLLRRQPALCEFAFTLLITSKSLLAGLAVLGFIISSSINYIFGRNDILPQLFLYPLVGLFTYFLLGIILSRPSLHDIVRLASLPLLIVYRIWLHGAAFFHGRTRSWVRTSRS